jgi:hypothetical protein
LAAEKTRKRRRSGDREMALPALEEQTFDGQEGDSKEQSGMIWIGTPLTSQEELIAWLDQQEQK